MQAEEGTGGKREVKHLSFLVCLSLFAFILYLAVDGLYEYRDVVEHGSYAEAEAFENKVRQASEDIGAKLVYLKTDDNNKVSFRVHVKRGDVFPYGKTRTGWFNWLGLSFQLLGVIWMASNLSPRKVKSLTPKGGLITPLIMTALAKTAFPNVPIAQPVGGKTTRKRAYKAQVVKDITIPKETTGIIAMRCWNLKNGKLLSMTIGGEWNNKIAIADKKPSAQNNSGIYAHRLGRRSNYNGDVWGIVAMYGRCRVGKNQGIIRAQRCDILLLITDNQEATELSKRYGVPVLITDDNEDLMEKWLISEDGIYWLKHNNDLLRDLITPKTDPIKQVEEILKQQNF